MKSSGPSQDAGWNDPPKFSYNESIELTRSPKKNVLNKRVAFPLNSTFSKSATSFLDPTAPPCNNPNLPPPPSIFTCSNEQNSEINLNSRLCGFNGLNAPNDNSEKDTTVHEVINIDINEITSSLEKMIEEKRNLLADNREELIKKKLKVMKESWESDRFDEGIKKQIFELTNALKEDHKEKANQIQVALMVDHPKLCSEFISAFRQLINTDEKNS